MSGLELRAHIGGIGYDEAFLLVMGISRWVDSMWIKASAAFDIPNLT